MPIVGAGIEVQRDLSIGDIGAAHAGHQREEVQVVGHLQVVCDLATAFIRGGRPGKGNRLTAHDPETV